VISGDDMDAHTRTKPSLLWRPIFLILLIMIYDVDEHTQSKAC
jgi:hypothetical protein